MLSNFLGTDRALIGLIGSMFFTGWTLACILFARIADVYGRKKFYLISLLVSEIIYAALILSDNLYLTIVLFFFNGMCTVGRGTISYVYLIEFI
jgi:MFS family permease